MSRTAKLTLVLTSSITGLTVWGVHFLQTSEREAMYQGVLRDDQRIKARLAQSAREAEFEDQKVKREYLEKLQPVSNPSGPKPEKPIQSITDDSPTGSIKFEGCKSC